MLGAIAGDIIGSGISPDDLQTPNFPLFSARSTFSDDTVLTFATAQVLLEGGSYAAAYRTFARRYPGRGYGSHFYRWAVSEDPRPYHSFGNGSAMRVSPVGFAFDDLETTLTEARRSAEVTHNHPEGIKGAQATALCILLARQGADKKTIKGEVTKRFGYDLTRPVRLIRQVNRFDQTCQGSVPEAISVFLESGNYEDCIRLAISIGGDSDTIACIAGGMAQAFYGDLPGNIRQEVLARLPDEFKDILARFESRFMVPRYLDGGG